MQVFYTVRPGDTLFHIARRWELPLDSLAAANRLTPPYTIFVGQQLSVPPGVDVYRVQPGDSVFRIAQRYGVPPAVIIEANQLRPPYLLSIGQLLRVPPGFPYYIVQPGDTLYHIASRFHVVTDGRVNHELIRMVNNLASDRIYPGMRLAVPYAPPGEDGLIAYTANRGGVFDMWLYDPGTGASRQLTEGLGEVFSVPFWSPDGSRIAFAGRHNILFVVRLADGAVARIDQLEEGLGVYLDWSSASRQLVYAKQHDIILYDIIRHQAERISVSEATDVQFFPNGEELLFQAPDDAGVSQLFVMQTDGSNRRQITENTGGRYNTVRLSPDGSRVLYTTPGVSISIIFTIDLATGETFEVRGGPLARNYFPAWSPDSENIAYSANAFEHAGYFSLIRTTTKQGENDRTSAISDCFATPVTWSPDSRKAAYLSGCDEAGTAREMWVVNTDFPVPVQLMDGVTIASLAWSPSVLSLSTYTNSVYQVAFQYQAHWQPVTDERYKGPDGFFQIAAIAAEDPLNAVCQNEAFHPLLPYGSNPRITHTIVQHQDACFIFPSADQPPEMADQAALIVRYPAPVQIEETTYPYFILWADQGHINQIAETLRFL
ncbi:TolB protein [Alteribacillus persepolensis]|uniref:TolB protein n=1 Tax=Alteribacillus persepolensis TaxID=568899 RepID=A0A1G8JS55_9BACI|nr:LysM peptidoglycan-binding domain-containing protein [Alteribacillus persepolensis]SDI33913.1 TolB protein [Alteribacillus persepolensis]